MKLMIPILGSTNATKEITKEVTPYGTKILVEGKIIAWERKSINNTVILKFLGQTDRFLKIV